MAKDPFGNPFATLSKNDRRELNSFFDCDDDGYEQVNGHDIQHDAHNNGNGAPSSSNDNGVAGNNYNNNVHYDEDYSHHEDEDEDDYEHGHGGGRSRNKKKRGRSNNTSTNTNNQNQNLGDIAPNLFSTQNAFSFNGIWFIVVGSLVFFLIGYWGLSKKASDKATTTEAALLANPNLNATTVPTAGGVVSSSSSSSSSENIMSSADKVNNNAVGTILNSNSDNNDDGGEEEGVDDDQPDDITPSSKTNKNANTNTNTNIMFNFNSQQSSALFDPFHLQATKIKDNNDWVGAPFVVSPPQLPSVTSNNNNNNNDGEGNDYHEEDVLRSSGNNHRLGYLQYPTISNGTLVFSTEGDLYLTRLLPPNSNNDGNNIIQLLNEQQQSLSPMTAMKLTTTVGNAIHPKLTPKFPHLLVYSATYSATREVYLMDLRPTTSTTTSTIGSLQGAPGTPGGPALRLTYTPGGIRSVVGWDSDGTSILYSAMSIMDSKSLPDVRLFRLRLSWGSNDDSRMSAVDEAIIGDSSKSSAAATVVSAGSEGSEKSADVGKDETHLEDETTDKKKRVEDENDTIIEQKEKSKDTSSYEDDDDDDDDDDDYTISDSQNYVDRVAAPDKPPVKEASASSGNKKKTKNSDNKKGKDDANNKRKLEKEERQRRHLAKLASAQAQRRRRRQRQIMTGTKKSSINSMIIEPVPLAQATEGLYHSDGCIYFTRFKQSSSTKRYVGGTAESLWAYCENQFDDLAIPLTGDYNGTSKSPSIHSIDGDDVLFFMSDRAAPSKSDNDTDTATFQWIASSMDLWAVALPISAEGTLGTPTRLTNAACQFNGIDLSEYTIDPLTGDVILRIGADLHFISSESIQAKFSGKDDSTGTSSIQQLPIAVYSDFSNMQERLIPLNIPHHITTLDAYATPYGTISTLLTARGQTFVAPVIPTKGIPQTVYGGGGRNMPARRHKVAPGSGGGGLVRILVSECIGDRDLVLS